MYRIAICDDNRYDVNEISHALDELRREGVSIKLTTYSNGMDIIADFEKGIRYHLLILDMVMEPINGIDTAKELRKSDVSMPILIVTSTRDFAVDGYLVNAWRYLTKPIDRKCFINEVRNILARTSDADERYYAFESARGITKVRLDDIIYFESNLHTITVHTMEQSYTFCGTISKIDEELVQNGFFRIHKSFLVNLRYVSNVYKQDVKIINGELLPLAKLRSAAMHEALLDYVSRSASRLGH